MTRDTKHDVKPVVNESGITISPVYTPDDVEASGGSTRVGEPGADLAIALAVASSRLDLESGSCV